MCIYKILDELLTREVFHSLKEAQVLIKMWGEHYNTVRPHSALVYRPPAPASVLVQPSQIQSNIMTGINFGGRSSGSNILLFRNYRYGFWQMMKQYLCISIPSNSLISIIGCIAILTIHKGMSPKLML